MTLPRRRFLQIAASAAALPALVRSARAQAYPSRPITMIVPYAAGGPTDTVGRVVTERMRAELGQTIVAENVGGAGGSIGLGRVARATPDGYTINVGNWSAHVVNGAIYTLPYDLRDRFRADRAVRAGAADDGGAKSVPANNLQELIAWLKENGRRPPSARPASAARHMSAACCSRAMAGARGQFVSYRGKSLAVQDLVAGQIDVVVSDPTTATPQVRAGAIKAFAIGGPARLPAAA